jgi:plasmid replication initiation protein
MRVEKGQQTFTSFHGATKISVARRLTSLQQDSILTNRSTVPSLIVRSIKRLLELATSQEPDLGRSASSDWLASETVRFCVASEGDGIKIDRVSQILGF